MTFIFSRGGGAERVWQLQRGHVSLECVSFTLTLKKLAQLAGLTLDMVNATMMPRMEKVIFRIHFGSFI